MECLFCSQISEFVHHYLLNPLFFRDFLGAVCADRSNTENRPELAITLASESADTEAATRFLKAFSDKLLSRIAR